MEKLIEGKVARILSENVIILNVGANAGVKPGAAFVVFARGEEVIDPETGEALGCWEVPKGHLRATHVQERMTTCESFLPGAKPAEQADKGTNVLSAALIAHSMRPETWRKSRVPLSVNRSDVSGMPSIGPISIGDPVREFPIGEPADKMRKPDKPAKKDAS